MKKIEHIGIAVKDIEASNNLFELLFDKPHYKIEEVESEGVKTSFFKCGPNKIELLQDLCNKASVIHTTSIPLLEGAF